WPVAHTAVEFVKAGLRMLRVEINETKGAVREMSQCPQDLVILLPHFFGGRIVTPFHAHKDAEPCDAHAVSIFEQLTKARLRGVPRHAGEVTVEIPDLSDESGMRGREVQNPKSEGRRPKEGRNPKAEYVSAALGFRFRNSD